MHLTDMAIKERPVDVGILAMEIYIPRYVVRQDELEKFDNVSTGKYTKGLGQQGMAFISDREDVVSMCMTVVKQILEKYSIDPQSIGRLEVGTESSFDKSKCVKTFLMDLFLPCGNSDIVGVDCISACYGGTAAFLNAVNWVESSSWDGRYALVVAADSAIYSPGPARAAGGCGAAALLIGPNAPLVLVPGCISTYMTHVYDFYKPTGLFPYVNGKQSICCYLKAIQKCFDGFCNKLSHLLSINEPTTEPKTKFVDFCVMHTPYSKLIQKAFKTLCLQQMQGQKTCGVFNVDFGENLDFKDESEISKIVNTCFNQMVEPSLLLNMECGNMYTASIFASLMSLVFNVGQAMVGKTILCSSYGSGLTASIYLLQVKKTQHPFSISNIAKQLDLKNRLSQRLIKSPKFFHQTLDEKEENYTKKFTGLNGSIEDLNVDTFYLESISEDFQRKYSIHHF